MTACRRPAVSTCLAIALGVLGTPACAPPGPDAAPAAVVVEPPKDVEHAGITEPHGDHAPHHGGLVLMNGDVHYEVVLDPAGRHAVWFTDAVRVELPASVARQVRLRVSRPDAPPEVLPLAIDESGESWIAAGQPVAGDHVTVTLSFDMQGAPHEIDIPFVPASR